jgi:hypothetical protein
MMTIGLIGLLVGTAASASGASLRLNTFQGPGNYRVTVGATVSFLGGMIVTLSVVSVLLSIF